MDEKAGSWRAIEDDFDKAYKLEAELQAKNKQELLDTVRSIKPKGVECYYVRQAEALGLGQAVLCAERMLGNEPFAVILADDLTDAKNPVMNQMSFLYARYGSSILGVQEIMPEQSRSYGVVAGNAFAGNLQRLHGIVEKPAPNSAPSNLGVIGRYILTPAIFKHLHATRPGSGDEIQLTDAIAALLREEMVLAYQFEGKRYDCGSKLGYLEATIALGLKHPEVKDEFAKLLNKHALVMTHKAKVIANTEAPLTVNEARSYARTHHSNDKLRNSA